MNIYHKVRCLLMRTSFKILLFFLVAYGTNAGILDTIKDALSCKTTIDLCPNENITFWLYTRSIANHPYQLNMYNLEDIDSAPFVKNVSFQVLIHGYTGDKDSSPNEEVRPALFRHADYNVISIDYKTIARGPCYVTAVESLKVVANCTAQLIDYLVEKIGVPHGDFHFIGHSLGSHVAGQISNYLKSGRPAHITGLEPALPLFTTFDSNKKLDKSDADFVDVIHTDVLLRGKLEPSGHVDFYVNGGTFQPGCDQSDMNPSSCNHVRAPIYYAESINSQVGFYGKNIECVLLGRCDLEIMGFYTPITAHGIYTVQTNDDPPYAKGRPDSK